MQKDKCNVFRHNFLSSQILGLLALNICSGYYESMLKLQHAFKVVFLGNDDIIKGIIMKSYINFQCQIADILQQQILPNPVLFC